jgi:hypothetical protein
MSKATAQWVPLAEVIYNYIDQAHLTSAEFRRLWALGIRGVNELGMDVFYTPKTEKLPVKPNKTVELPSDYLAYTKIGVLNADGEVATLKRNPNKTAYKIADADRTSNNTDEGIGDAYDSRFWSYVNYYSGAGYVNLFGNGSMLNDAGEFNIDEEQGYIYLDNDFAYDYIILEYLSDASNDQDFKIPIQIVEATIAFLAWKDIEFLASSRKVNMGEKQLRKSNYYNQKRLAKQRVNPIRLWEANSTIRAGQKLVVKG